MLTGPADREGIPCYVRVTQGPSVGEASDSPFVPPNAGFVCFVIYNARSRERPHCLGAEKNGPTVLLLAHHSH